MFPINFLIPILCSTQTHQLKIEKVFFILTNKNNCFHSNLIFYVFISFGSFFLFQFCTSFISHHISYPFFVSEHLLSLLKSKQNNCLSLLLKTLKIHPPNTIYISFSAVLRTSLCLVLNMLYASKNFAENEEKKTSVH